MTLDEFNEKTYQRNNRYINKPQIICNDGFKMSVQGSQTHYCSPRENSDMYWEMEVGYPSVRVDEFMEYAENPDQPTNTVYGWVPCDIIQNVIDQHGGINVELTFKTN